MSLKGLAKVRPLRFIPWWVALPIAFLAVLIPTLLVLADVSLSTRFSGTGQYAIVANGVGLNLGVDPGVASNGDISLTVPASATNIVQAYLYWSGNDNSPGGDDTIDFGVNGGATTSITADVTFGPEFWFSVGGQPDRFNYAYVEDITASILTGTNTYNIRNVGVPSPLRENYGAGIMVVYEDPSLLTSEVVINDGLDSAFHGFPAPRGPNTETTCFTFTAAAAARTIDITLFVGGVESAGGSIVRPNSVWTIVGSGSPPSTVIGAAGASEDAPAPAFPSAAVTTPLQSNDGDEWDTYAVALSVPAGDTFACVQLESNTDYQTIPQNGASIIWINASASIPSAIQPPTATPTSPPPTSTPTPVGPTSTPDPGATPSDPGLPDTGFAPGVQSFLPPQPAESAYKEMGDFSLSIPDLGVELPILGIPLGSNGWDVSWLSNQAGYLETTAFPTWRGNTALTGHAVLADGSPGPFAELRSLRWNDEIEIEAFGLRYIYSVRDVRYVVPNDSSVLQHKEEDWITLITCYGYEEIDDSYTWRVAVQAVLIRIENVN